MLDPCGEPADGDQVGQGAVFLLLTRPGGFDERLGQQPERPDRGLELVADVGDEVPADPCQPMCLCDVDRLDGDVPLAERDDPHVHPERLAATAADRRPWQIELSGPRLSAPAYLPGKRTDDHVDLAADVVAGADGSTAQFALAAVDLTDHAEFSRADIRENQLICGVEHQDTDLEGVQRRTVQP